MQGGLCVRPRNASYSTCGHVCFSTEPTITRVRHTQRFPAPAEVGRPSLWFVVDVLCFLGTPRFAVCSCMRCALQWTSWSAKMAASDLHWCEAGYFSFKRTAMSCWASGGLHKGINRCISKSEFRIFAFFACIIDRKYFKKRDETKSENTDGIPERAQHCRGKRIHFSCMAFLPTFHHPRIR